MRREFWISQITGKWYVRERSYPMERLIAYGTHGPYESEEEAKGVMEQFQGEALGDVAQVGKEKMEV